MPRANNYNKKRQRFNSFIPMAYKKGILLSLTSYQSFHTYFPVTVIQPLLWITVLDQISRA
jgi:hypothetical protein